MRCAVLGLAFFAAVPLAWAQLQQENRNAPMNIEADTLIHDQIKGITVATGNVVVARGGMLIKAEKVEVRQDVLGYQNVIATGSAEALAYWYQKGRMQIQAKQPDADIEAFGERIVYNGSLDEVQLIDRAIFRRILNGQLQDEVEGKRIVYNNIVDTYCVESRVGQCKNLSLAKSQAKSSENSGRVKVTIGPRP